LKIIPPHAMGDKPTGHFSKAQMQREMARQAAMEKEMARYIQIACGHVSDLETQQRYAVFRPKKKGQFVFCETCGKWLRPKTYRVTRQNYPETPLF
jgi:hypothetical protein